MWILNYSVIGVALCIGFMPNKYVPKKQTNSLQSVRKDTKTGKIYIGEPEPLDELKDNLGELLDGIGRAVDRVLGPKPIPTPIPIPIPIPVEDEFPPRSTQDYPKY